MQTFKQFLTEEVSKRNIQAFINAAEQIEKSEGIEAAEENWKGGIADFGDSDAAFKVMQMPGYFDYFSQLEELAFKYLGQHFEVFRAMPDMDLDDIGKPIAASLDMNVARGFARFAAHAQDQQLFLTTLIAQPSAIVMFGSPEERELVLDPQQLTIKSKQPL